WLWFQTHNRSWLWLATTWVPGMPRRVSEIWSMMRFGGTMTLLTGTDEPNERVRGTEVTTSEPAGQEMVYAARISLDRPPMQVEDKLVPLTPVGGDRGDQDRLAHRAELSALAAHALPARELAGAVRNSPPPGDE